MVIDVNFNIPCLARPLHSVAAREVRNLIGKSRNRLEADARQKGVVVGAGALLPLRKINLRLSRKKASPHRPLMMTTLMTFRLWLIPLPTIRMIIMTKVNLEKKSRRLRIQRSKVKPTGLNLSILQMVILKRKNPIAPSARQTFLLSRRAMCAMLDDPGSLVDHHFWIQVLAMAAAAATA